jgi:superfamily I DNA/RNA helicase
MPLSLHCGPFSFLEESFVSHLTANPPGVGRRVAVVTTSQRMGERLQRVLSSDRGHAFFNLWFHTLHSLSLDILRPSGVTLPVVNNDEIFHERLVERLLVKEATLPPERARALAGAYRATLRDMVEAGVDTVRFREHFEDMEFSGEEKFYQLLSLADRYRDALVHLNVAGSADLARLAAETVENLPDALSFYDEIIYYGFYDLNGAQSDFFSAVARQGQVTLFFPCVKGHAGYSFAERFLELKIRVGGAEAHWGESNEIGPLGRAVGSLFDPSQPPVDPAGPLHVINVSGERDEVWRVAKEIVHIREEHTTVAWDEIGVVARGLDAYAGLIPEIFGAHGIPFSLSDGGPLLSHPVARLAADLISVGGRVHDRDLLLDIIGSPSIRQEAIAGSTVEEIRTYLVNAGPRAGVSHLCASSPSGPSDIPSDLRLPDPPPALLAMGARLKGPGAAELMSWTQHVSLARERIDHFVATTPENEPVLRGVVTVLERLEELDRFSPPVREEEFSDTFSDALRRGRRPGTGAVHGVRVLGAMEARGERFGTLFLLGLKEGVFPRVVREDPLLSDDLRRILRDPGGYWILPKREGYDEEKLLFTLLVSSAKDRLYLLYPRSGADGRAEVPSLYLRDLARATGISLEEGERLPRPPLEKWNAVSRTLLTPQEAGLVDLLEDLPVTGEWKDISRRGAQLSAWTVPSAIDGQVGAPEKFLARCRERGLSPSAVESLATCPFEFFISRPVGVRPAQAMYDEEGVTPLALGRIQHVLLQKVYAGFVGHAPPEIDEVAARLRRETQTLFSLLRAQRTGPYPLLWLTLQERVEGQLVAFVRKDVARLREEGFRPEKLEWGLAGPLPGTDFFWTGRLDRMDWNPVTRRFHVVDYKNKIRKDSLTERVGAGQVYQAPVYFDLVESQKVWGTGEVRYEYLSTNETEVFSEESWRAQRGFQEARLKELLSVLSEGRFLIHPTEGPTGHCHLCAFARACRKSHGPSRKRAAGVFGPSIRAQKEGKSL